MGREKADARPHCLPYPVLPFSQLGIFMRFVPLWLPVRDILRTVFRMAFYEKTPGFTVLLLFVAAFTACSYCVIWLDRTMPCALDLVTLMSPRTLADDFADVDADVGLGIAAGHPLVLALQSRQKQTLMTSYCSGGKTLFQLAEAPRLSDARDPYLASAKLAPPTRAAFAVLSSIYNASGGGRVGSGDKIGGAAEGRGSSEGGAKSGDGGWMLDVGANVGFFTAHAAAAGMRVLSFDPQPACLAMLHQSLTTSGLQPSVRLIHAALGTRPSTSSSSVGTAGGTAGSTAGTIGTADNTKAPLLDMNLPGDMCHGRYLAQGGGRVSGPEEPQQWGGRMHRGAVSLQSDAGGGVEDAQRLPRPAAMPLSRFLEARHVRVLRIDVEGDEVHVLESGGAGGGAAASLHDIPDRCKQGALLVVPYCQGVPPGAATSRSALGCNCVHPDHTMHSEK